jgi:hypothetical protein
MDTWPVSEYACIRCRFLKVSRLMTFDRCISRSCLKIRQ